jgi:hypothetical protein
MDPPFIFHNSDVHISKRFETIFFGSGNRNLFDPGSGMEKLGSGISIPDPQY